MTEGNGETERRVGGGGRADDEGKSQRSGRANVLLSY